MQSYGAHETVNVPYLVDDVDIRPGQETRQALADYQGVIGYDDPHGSSTISRVPRPGGLLRTR
jgi:hypothetical protein